MAADLEIGVTEPINFRNFLQQWQEEIGPHDESTPSNRGFSLHLKEYNQSDVKLNFQDFATMEMENDVVSELDAECRPESLTHEAEPKDVETLMNEIPPEVELSCVRNQKEELEHRQREPMYRKKTVIKMKYRVRDAPWRHEVAMCMTPTSRKATFPDVILTVQVYRPFMKRRQLTLELEFHVLGQQMLSELRDKIICVSDYLAVSDMSENPEQQSDVLSKDLYKSSFFFIEGFFYNDMRDLSCHDYSKTIIDWAKDPSRGIGPFQSRRMETTRFIDLTARLGQPYIYVHQGDCEHLLIFSDLRLMHPEDCCYLDQYPLVIYKSRERKPKCRVCQLYLAKWLTSGSSLAPEDPCYFCDTCFRALHYDNTGKKIVPEMKAYPFPDIRELKK